MRYIRYAFLAIVGITLLIIALANRGLVTLRLLPGELAEFAGTSPAITLPLFVVIFCSIVAGLLIGFIWEWTREHKHRTAAAAHRREKEHLAREVEKLRGPENTKDEVLAILDEASPAR